MNSHSVYISPRYLRLIASLMVETGITKCGMAGTFAEWLNEFKDRLNAEAKLHKTTPAEWFANYEAFLREEIRMVATAARK